MKPDREEVSAAIKGAVKNNKAKQMNDMLTKMEQAAIQSEHLTHDPSWDIFLQMLQGWVEATEISLETFDITLRSPNVVNPDQIYQLKNYILQCQERIDVLGSVIALPHQIIKAGVEAKLELEKIGRDNDKTKDA